MKKLTNFDFEIYSKFKPKNKLKEWLNDNYDWLIPLASIMLAFYLINKVVIELLSLTIK